MYLKQLQIKNKNQILGLILQFKLKIQEIIFLIVSYLIFSKYRNRITKLQQVLHITEDGQSKV